jgi:glycerophosphoryl diester phosphodiesterase
MATAQIRAMRAQMLRSAALRGVASLVIVGSIGVAAAVAPATTSVQAASSFAFAAGDSGPFVAGHRGDSVRAPENTIPAFEAALASGAAFLETDVQLTSDGVPVLMHDWMLDRTTSGDGPVWAKTFEEIRALDAGAWYSPEFAGVQVPTLDEFLGLLVPSGRSAMIELKGAWNEEQVSLVVRQVLAHGLRDRVLLASFDVETLGAIDGVAPSIQRAIILRKPMEDPRILADLLGISAIVTSSAAVAEDAAWVERIRAASLGTLLYTLNEDTQWEQAVGLGVDGIITDCPDDLNRWMQGR